MIAVARPRTLSKEVRFLTLAGWPAEVPAGEDMDVEVADALPDGPAAVDDDAERAAVAGIGRNLPDDLQEPSADLLVSQLEHVRDVRPRDDERVEGRLRGAILERDDVLVLIEELRGDLAARDLAEHTVSHAARIPIGC